MTITLSGQVYAVVRDMAEQPLVIVQRSARMWRPANHQDALRVLRGLAVAPLKLQLHNTGT